MAGPWPLGALGGLPLCREAPGRTVSNRGIASAIYDSTSRYSHW